MSTFDLIQQYCIAHGISIHQLAEKANVSPGTIYNWKYRDPSTKNISKIAKALNISIKELLPKTEESDSSDSEPAEVDLNNNANLYFYDGKPIPKEDMDYVRGLLKHLGEARNN